MPGHDIIVVGASLGGVEALTELVRDLPADLPAAVFIVIHTPATAPGLLGPILDRRGPLRAAPAADGEPIRHGRIYVAPPNHHLLVHGSHVALSRGPRENRCRPAIDPLFRSAAIHHTTRVVGVVLTGLLDDGSAGLLAVQRCGGVAVVQDPKDARYPDMPKSALALLDADHVVPLRDMGRCLSVIARSPAAAPSLAPDAVPIGLRMENAMAEQRITDNRGDQQIGRLADFTCPECSGPLWELKNDEAQRYRCNVGHAYTARSLLSSQDEAVEASMWVAIRQLDDRANLLHRMAETERTRGRTHAAALFERDSADSRMHATRLRDFLTNAHPRAGLAHETNGSTDEEAA